MYYIYILHAASADKFYVGYSDDPHLPALHIKVNTPKLNFQGISNL